MFLLTEKYFRQSVLRLSIDFKLFGNVLYDYPRHNFTLRLEHIAKGMFYSQEKPTSEEVSAKRYRCNDEEIQVGHLA